MNSSGLDLSKVPDKYEIEISEDQQSLDKNLNDTNYNGTLSGNFIVGFIYVSSMT